MTVVLVLALVAPAAAQPKEAKQPVEGFGLIAETELHWPFWVTASPDVQKELKLTKEQLTAFERAQADLKKGTADLGLLTPAQMKAQIAKLTKWADETVASVLTPEQQKRHRQLVWQVLEFNGGVLGMASNPVFAKEVGLSADQLKQAKKLDADYQAAWQKLARANPNGNAALPGEEALTKKYEAAALKLLTAEQKKKWNAALGEPFQGEIKQYPVPGLRPVTFKPPAEKK